MRLLRPLVLALLLAPPAARAAPNVTEPFQVSCISQSIYYLPSFTQVPGGGTTVGAETTAGRATCGRIHAPCNGTIDGLGLVVGTLVAANHADVAIYSNDGTTLIAHSGLLDVSTAGPKFVSGLSGTITAHTDYLACYATSATATIALASAVGSNQTAGAYYNNTAKDPVVRGAASAGNLAQFNENCTANVTPYACCTGVGTGTCVGFTNGLGTLVTGSSSGLCALMAIGFQ